MSADFASGEAPKGVLRGAPRLQVLVAVYTFSNFGSAVAMLAFTYVSYVITGSLMAAVIIAAVSALPALVLVRPATSLTLSYDLRWVCGWLAMLKAALFVVVGVLLDLGYLSFWLLFFTSLANGILGAFIFPAWNDFVREIAPGGRVAALDSALMSFSAIAGIFGVIVGGLMLDAWGPGSLFLLNGFSYVLYAIPFALFPAVRAAPVGTGRGSLGESLQIVRDTEALRSFVIIAVMVQLVAWPLLNLLPEISTNIGSNAIIFSLLLSSLYAGMALVAPILSIREKRYSHWHIAIVALIILMIATGLVALSPMVGEGARLVVLMVVLVPLGMALNMTSVLTSAAVQTGAPREHVPGVLALYSALVTVVAPVGALVITGIADASNVWVAVLVEALGIGVLLLYLASPRVRGHFVTALAGRHHVVHHHARHGSVPRTLPGDVTPVGRHRADPVALDGPPGA